MVCMSLTTGVLGARGVSDHTKMRMSDFFSGQIHKTFAKSIRDILEENDHKIWDIATGKRSDNCN